jgi:hypothetical protein
MTKPYQEVYEKGFNGEQTLLALVFTAPNDAAATQNRVRILEHTIELRDALKECLDALYNETAGDEDTSWITAVKKRAADALVAVEGVPEPLKSDLVPRILASCNAIERHALAIRTQMFTDQVAVPLSFLLSEVRSIREELSK